MILHDIALSWMKQGFTTVPIYYQSKRPMILWQDYQDKTPTEFELLQWFASDMRNIGLITGNGLVVIDFDVMEVFDYWQSLFSVNTYMVKTSRGVHVYVKTQQPASNFHGDLLDIKAERGYVLIPPSIHPSGHQYQVLKDSPILSIEKLSDVLPDYFTPEPEKVNVGIVSQHTEQGNDPWAIADNALNIDENTIKKIKQSYSILNFFPDAKPTSRDSRWFTTLCPFHQDHTPSFWIDTIKGICGCRKCNIKEMDVLDLYARLHNISNKEAILELGKGV